MKLFRALPLLLVLAACASGSNTANNADGEENPAMTGPTYHWDQNQTGTGDNDEPLVELNLLDEDNESQFTAECVGPAFTEGVAADVPGVQTAIRCWWAGGGDDYAVIDMSGSLVIRHRTVDEEAGYGPWETVENL